VLLVRYSSRVLYTEYDSVQYRTSILHIDNGAVHICFAHLVRDRTCVLKILHIGQYMSSVRWLWDGTYVQNTEYGKYMCSVAPGCNLIPGNLSLDPLAPLSTCIYRGGMSSHPYRYTEVKCPYSPTQGLGLNVLTLPNAYGGEMISHPYMYVYRE
jgi:hypothetical protein